MAQHTYTALSGDGLLGYVQADAGDDYPPDAEQAQTIDTTATTIKPYGYTGYPYPRGTYRGYLYFPTSTIPSNAVISNATLRPYIHDINLGGSYGNTYCDLEVWDGQPNYPDEAAGAPDLWVGDFDRTLYAKVASYYAGDMVEHAWNDFAFPTTSVRRAGLTKICLRNNYEVGVCAACAQASVTIRSGNYASYQPQLIVDYTVPIAASASMTTSSSMSAAGRALRLAQASLSSSASMTAIPWGVIEATVSMESAASMVCAGSVTLAEFLKWYGTLGPGDVLVIDCNGRTALLNGVNDLKNLQGEWVYLSPGDNEVEYRDSAEDRAVNVLVAHSPRWA